MQRETTVKSIVHLRISDNVLKDEDWGYVEATIVNGRITALREVEQGCYGWGYAPTVSWKLGRLLAWLDHDSTGSHPEQYHEIRIPTGSWLSCSIDSVDKLKELLELAAVHA